MDAFLTILTAPWLKASLAATLRSRCDSVRTPPEFNSHCCPALAPQVGQGTSSAACFLPMMLNHEAYPGRRKANIEHSGFGKQLSNEKPRTSPDVNHRTDRWPSAATCCAGVGFVCGSPRGGRVKGKRSPSIVQNHVEQRTMHFHGAVVLDESQLSEPVHEEVDARAGGTHHFRQGFLRDVGDDGLRLSFFAKTG